MTEPDASVWDEVIKMNEIATALAWRSLCREALRGPSPTLETRKLSALLCTRNLAVHLTRAGCRYAESRQVFRQAAWLAPHDTGLRLYEEHWQKVQSLETELQETWGLGCDRKGGGYRRRLRRLCEFLLSLESGDKSDRKDISDFLELQEKLQRPVEAPVRTRPTYLRLKGLYGALKTLEPPSASPVQAAKDRLAYLERWRLGAVTLQNELAERLQLLGALPDNTADKNLVISLRELRDRLDSLQSDEDHRSQLAGSEERWDRFFEECLGDWRWARLQVIVRLARQCLDGTSSGQDCCDLAKEAEEYLQEAIPLLETKGFLQPQGQGLYGLLARTALHRATHPSTGPEKRAQLIESALAYVRTSVEKEPENVRERLVLLEILSELGDSDEMAVQAEIARNLDSGSKTLQVIGRSYWKRIFALHDREARRQLLVQAVKFFADTLKQVESAAFDRRDPIEPMQAHGWAHFWLGRFLCEIGKTGEAIGHLRTAAELSFHPLESRVELAWACLIARDRRQADAAFGGACCHLGLAKAAQAKEKVEGALERAEELYHLALESDVRGRYEREITGLGDKLKELRTPAVAPATDSTLLAGSASLGSVPPVPPTAPRTSP